MGDTKVFQPQYFKNFKCTCGDCSSNCCEHDWQIHIDKNTYDKYMRLGEDERQEFSESIRIVSSEPFIAIMLTRNDGGCHFLNEKGFCSIQLKHGYDYLSRTCRIHPRSISYVAGEFETFLELSCEEAVRVVLFDKSLMKFEESILEPDGSGNVIPNRMLTAEKYTSAKSGAELFQKLRMASLRIMQSRQYTVRIRMLILCMFIQQLDELLTNAGDLEVIRYCNGFLDALETGVYDTLANELPDGVDSDVDFVLDILRDIEAKNDKRFNSNLHKALEGHGISIASEVPVDFTERYKNSYKHFFSDREYVFENFIVNHILMEGFPFNFNNDSGSVMKNYADLLAKFNLIEFLVVGVCSFHNMFDEWSIIDCVSAFSRKYDHSEKGYLTL